MEIISNAAIKLNLDPQHVAGLGNIIQRSEAINDREFLFAWDYEEAAAAAYYLDSLGPDPALPQIPSPLLRDYGFPRIFPDVYGHQKQTASFLSLRRRAFCFNEAGTGKTGSALWASDFLMGLGLVKRVLIICPMSIMYSAWQAEVFKTVMHRTCGVAYGDKSARIKIINGGYDYTIINFDGVGVVRDEISAARFDLIIGDEANAWKNASTKRWKTLVKLINPSTFLWMMTGTPASQSPMDAFGLARLVSPERVPKFMTAWRDKVMWQVTRFKWEPKTNARDQVFQALQPAIRFTKSECLDLPPVVYETREVPLSPQVASYYKKLKNQLLIEAAGEEISAVNAAARMSKLLQISSGCVYSDSREIVEFDITPRLNVLEEIIEEASNKILVFIPYLHTIECVQKFLNGKKYTTEIIRGDVTVRERTRIFNQFQTQPDPRILLIQPQSASHGVTLTAADTIVFFSPVLSIETRLQCLGRLDRIGQQNKVLVVDLVGSDIERLCARNSQKKLEQHLGVVDLYKALKEE